MFRWMRSLLAWRVVDDTGVWIYEQNSITGNRRIVRRSYSVHQPVNRAWLKGGPLEIPRRPPGAEWADTRPLPKPVS